MLQPGDPAPDFQAVSQRGEPVSLADFRGKQAVVLYFYPRDFTPMCTQEACGFRDAYEDFLAAGAAVIGVSVDSDERHGKFAEQYRLPFLLVSDTDGALRKAYDVPKLLGFLPSRVTYVIDREGVIRSAFRSDLSAGKHVQEALRAVQGMQGAP